MKKFLVLYRSTPEAIAAGASMTSEQRNAEMEKWTAWGASIGSSLADWGAPLGEFDVLRGSPGPTVVGGYSIVQADSLEAAKGLFDTHPHLGSSGDSIELLEMLPMPGA